MKILLVNCVYNKGSTGKIVYDIHNELLSSGIDSVVCYGRGELISDQNIYKTCGEFASNVNHFIANASGVLYGGCFQSTNKLISIIKKERPDIVHLHCLNGFFVNIYRLIKWLKNHHIKTVLTLHAEFMYTGGCSYALDCNQWCSPNGCGKVKCPLYRTDMKVWFFDRSRTMWKRMKRAFDGFSENLVVTSVSPWLMERAKQSPILSGKQHRVILNGLDTSVFRSYDNEVSLALKTELGIGSERVIFHATANFNNNPNHIKGGYYILELAKRMPSVTFVVAGHTTLDSDLPKNVILLGKVTEQTTLAKLYSMADLSVITSKKETFSMIVAESLCCGTPVVGFQAGAPEMIALPEYSAFSEYGNLDALEQVIQDYLNSKFDSKVISETAFTVYSKEIMVKQYKDLYTRLVDKSDE